MQQMAPDVNYSHPTGYCSSSDPFLLLSLLGYQQYLVVVKVVRYKMWPYIKDVNPFFTVRFRRFWNERAEPISCRECVIEG